jgi:hypothetical protein
LRKLSIELIKTKHRVFSHSRPEEKAHVMTCALKVIHQTLRENRTYFSILELEFIFIRFLLGNQSKHMRIQDKFQSDGISY